MTKPRRFDSLEAWLDWLQTLHPKQIDMSLGRVKGVLAALGISRPPYRIVTVAGTNGKGSCVALLESVYLAAGYEVGAFTSPHLIRFNERIRCNGQDLEDDALVELFELIDASRGELTLSYFEASAVAAMLHFARAGVDVALLEVGMGGRLDAVNAVDADVALIVSIALDHMDWLGPDRDSIGREKAGIVRSGRPVVIADPDPPAGLIDEIDRRGGTVVCVGRDFHADSAGGEFTYRDNSASSRRFALPPFGGPIQAINAAAVVAVVDALREQLPLADSAIATGLARARLRGRQEVAQLGSCEWIFDVAHNPASAELFHDSLQRLASVPSTIAVFGAMHDKDLASVLERFVHDVERWFVGGIDSERGADPASVEAILRELGADRVETFPDVAAAATAARAAGAARVLVFGSFYTVGPVMHSVGLY